jgi:hypothetical protein
VDQRQIWCWDPGVGVDLGDTVTGAWRAASVGVDLALGLGLGSPVGSETGSPVGSGFFLFFNSLTKAGICKTSASVNRLTKSCNATASVDHH